MHAFPMKLNAYINVKANNTNVFSFASSCVIEKGECNGKFAHLVYAYPILRQLGYVRTCVARAITAKKAARSGLRLAWRKVNIAMELLSYKVQRELN